VARAASVANNNVQKAIGVFSVKPASYPIHIPHVHAVKQTLADLEQVCVSLSNSRVARGRPRQTAILMILGFLKRCYEHHFGEQPPASRSKRAAFYDCARICLKAAGYKTEDPLHYMRQVEKIPLFRPEFFPHLRDHSSIRRGK